MHRPFHLTAGVLAALTAVALLGAAVAVRPPGYPAEADGPGEAANRALAFAFYDAANTAIATGDLAPLANLVAPNLLADEPAEGGRAGQVGLGQRLLALHAATPTLRLTVEALAVDGDLAIAHLAAGPTAPAAFLGLTHVDPPLAWGPVDVLRLADGRVVEHTSNTEDTARLEAALSVPRELSADAPHVLTVRRVTLAAGATHGAAAVDGFRHLHLEAGAVTVEVVATAWYAAQPVPLAAGEHLAVPTGVAYAARNAGDAPAVLLDLTAERPLAPITSGAGPATPPHPGEPPAEAGVVTSILAHGRTSALPAGPVVLAVGRASLAPGARLAWAEAAGPVLLHVEAGTASLDPGAGTAWAPDASGWSAALGDAPLTAGNGTLIEAATAAEIRAGADLPATLLIVTLLPADEPAPTASPTPLS